MGFVFGALLGVGLGFYLAASEGWREWWQLWTAVVGLGALRGACAAYFGRAFWDAVFDAHAWPWPRR